MCFVCLLFRWQKRELNAVALKFVIQVFSRQLDRSYDVNFLFVVFIERKCSKIIIKINLIYEVRSVIDVAV